MLAATLEQRLTAHLKIARRRGLDDDAALAYAYAQEGLAPPKPPEIEKTLEEQFEDILWKYHCAERRANVVTERAARLAAENRRLKQKLASK